MPVHDWTRVPPNIFHHFHTTWITAICNSLNDGVLPDDHYALLEQSAQQAVPDVVALRAGEPRDWSSDAHGVVAVAEHPPKVDVTLECDFFPERQRQIAIRHPSGEVVAIIELVSSENKSSRQSLDRFTNKIASAIKQGNNVLVIDLFPPGKHNPQGIHPAIWDSLPGEPLDQPLTKPLTLASYEATSGAKAYLCGLSVGDKLPSMPIFLAPGWYVVAPLEATYDETSRRVPQPWRNVITG
jgi:hypothetical protein